MPTCNYWSPELVCDRPLKTAQELRGGCCARCAKLIDEASKRNMLSIERRVAEEAGPDLQDDAIQAVRDALDNDPNMAW
jgi:hypothetical protein